MVVSYPYPFGPHRVRWPGLDGIVRQATYEHTELGMQRLHWQEYAEVMVATGELGEMSVDDVLDTWERCPGWAPVLPSSPLDAMLSLLRRYIFG